MTWKERLEKSADALLINASKTYSGELAPSACNASSSAYKGVISAYKEHRMTERGNTPAKAPRKT